MVVSDQHFSFKRQTTDLTKLPPAIYKVIDPRTGVYSKAVLKENANFMLTMGEEKTSVRRAKSCQPGKNKGLRPMHASTLVLEHESPTPAQYSRHFRSRLNLKAEPIPANYPSQFISQIVLEHDHSSVLDSSHTTNKRTFMSWTPPPLRDQSRENNKHNMRCGVKGAEVVFESIEPKMYKSTYNNYFGSEGLEF